MYVICWLQEMFDATLKDRQQSFDSAPGTTMFLHWLVGMVYVFYFASFILLLREVSAGLWPLQKIFFATCAEAHTPNLQSFKKCGACFCGCRCSGLACCGSWGIWTTPTSTQSKRWSTCPSTDTCGGSYSLWSVKSPPPLFHPKPKPSVAYQCPGFCLL